VSTIGTSRYFAASQKPVAIYQRQDPRVRRRHLQASIKPAGGRQHLVPGGSDVSADQCRALHQTFNGSPDNLKLKRATGVMYELRLLANDVVSTPISDTGYTAAPTFEYTTLPQ
jgi:hypothetical protein